MNNSILLSFNATDELVEISRLIWNSNNRERITNNNEDDSLGQTNHDLILSRVLDMGVAYLSDVTGEKELKEIREDDGVDVSVEKCEIHLPANRRTRSSSADLMRFEEGAENYKV